MAYELTGRIKDLSLDFRNDKPILTLEINEKQSVSNLFDELHNTEKLAIKIDKFREKRSLDANALLWKACGAIADALGVSKDDVYIHMLKKYGQTFVVKVPNEHIKKFKRQYKYIEQHEKLPPEERAQYFRVWLGSSGYDTKEMSILLDGVISELKEMGINFTSPDEVSLYLTEWKGGG